MQEPHNISIYPGTGVADGKNGDAVLLCPAYNVTAKDVEMIVATTAEVIKKFFDEKQQGHVY